MEKIPGFKINIVEKISPPPRELFQEIQYCKNYFINIFPDYITQKRFSVDIFFFISNFYSILKTTRSQVIKFVCQGYVYGNLSLLHRAQKLFFNHNYQIFFAYCIFFLFVIFTILRNNSEPSSGTISSLIIKFQFFSKKLYNFFFFFF